MNVKNEKILIMLSGAEFVNPLPESSNHFVSVFVFHRSSRTLHVDDTIVYGDHPSFLLKLIGFKQIYFSYIVLKYPDQTCYCRCQLTISS